MTRPRAFAAAAALLLAVATLTGAFGAHVLKSRWPEARLALLQTAVHYQFFHSLGLLLLAVAGGEVRARGLLWPMRLLLAGVLLFCGSLYALAAGAPAWIGAVTPVGGLCFIGGWLLAALAFWRGGDSG